MIYRQRDIYTQIPIDIDTIRISGTFYHGTSIKSDDEIISCLSSEYSDYDAVWLTKDEYVAEKYAHDRCRDGEIGCVLKTTIDINNIAYMDDYTVRELMDYYSCLNAMDLIPILITHGFKGWLVSGSIGGLLYDDYAVFDDIHVMSIKKIYDSEWSEYKDI